MKKQQNMNKLKVIDLSTVLAGPSVVTFFAELGAEVIKIEHPLLDQSLCIFLQIRYSLFHSLSGK